MARARSEAIVKPGRRVGVCPQEFRVIRRKVRHGDLLAGTWVVRAPKTELDLDLIDTGSAHGPVFAFTDAQLDAYGVLNVGETPIEGAVERIAALRAAGKRVMVVSNSAGYPKARMMQRYARLGFDFTPSEVVTSREALFAHLADVPTRRWGMMLNVSNGTDDLNGIDAHVLADDPAAYDAAEGILLVGSDGWTDARQDMLEI